MTEEIIIDGVNVAGCENYYEMDDCDGCHQLCNNATDINNEYCEHYKDCYYKQLKRLEQENKELKELNKEICEDWEREIKVYWNTLEEIREIAMGIMDDDIDEGSAYYDADQIINKTNEVLNG